MRVLNVIKGAPGPCRNHSTNSLWRCSAFGCKKAAEGTLHSEDGEVIPTPHMCKEHAKICIIEYFNKLDEVWAFAPYALGPIDLINANDKE